MSDAIIVALLGFAGTAIGSMVGSITAQKLMQYRIAKLEEKAAKQEEGHISLKERTTRLEGRMNEAEHDIEFLKLHHAPK